MRKLILLTKKEAEKLNIKHRADIFNHIKTDSIDGVDANYRVISVDNEGVILEEVW